MSWDPVNLVDPSGLAGSDASKVASLANTLEWFANIAYQGTMGGLIVGDGSDGIVVSDDSFSALNMCSIFVAKKFKVKYKLPNAKSGVPDDSFKPSKSIETPYIRTQGAGPTKEQRKSVQGQPCVDCGNVTSKQIADHKLPLVVEYYKNDSINISKQTKINAVQPHCPQCSSIQGGQLGAFGKKMK